MDLKVFDTKTKANSGIWIDIINPNTGEPSGIRWKIAGLDSDRFTDFSKRAASNGKLRKAIQDKEEEYEYDIEMVAELSLGWEDTGKDAPPSGTIVFNGKELKFSTENAKTVLRALPAIKRQVNRQILKEQNFLSD